MPQIETVPPRETISPSEKTGVAIPQPLTLIPASAEFEGIPVRIVTVNGTQMMPVVDIARALKINRGSLTRSLRDKLFEGKTMVCKVATPKGAQGMVCITSLGAVGLLYKIDAKDSENNEIKKRVSSFQEWATKMVQKEMQIQSKPPVQETVRPASGTVSEVIGKYMEGARAASREMGVPLDLAMAKALVLAGRDLHMDLTGFARLLPASPTGNDRLAIAPAVNAFAHEGYLSAEEIAMRLGGGLRGKNVNKYLKNHGFIYKNEEKRWCMTDLGAHYGKVFPYAAGSGHVGYYICWMPEVMRASGMAR